jgi:hypothetical protein
MVRIWSKDFIDQAWTTKLAAAGALTKAEFISRFGKYS